VAVRIINNIELKRESRSFIDCLHSVLTAAGIFNTPKFMLSGMTALAFKFIMHKTMIPSSLEMYSRPHENWWGVNILGIYSETHGGFKNDPAFCLYRKHGVDRIKESIDRNVGAILWAPDYMEFAIVHGYDDSDGVFYYKDRRNSDDQVLLYENLGLVKNACWHYHVFWNEKVSRDIKDIYSDSLIEAVYEWDVPYKLERETNAEYGSGKKAYEYILNALENRDFDDFGACYNMNANVISKNEISRYMEEVVEEIPELSCALVKYKELDGIYKDIDSIIPKNAMDYHIDMNHIPKLIKEFKKAMEVEEAAIREIKDYFKETLNNMFFDIYETKDL
jgi:hypothetical protein